MLRQSGITGYMAFVEIGLFVVSGIPFLTVIDIFIGILPNEILPVRFVLPLNRFRQRDVGGVFLFQYGIGEKFFLNVGVQFLNIKLKDPDRLDQFRRHDQFLTLFDCQVISKLQAHSFSPRIMGLTGAFSSPTVTSLYHICRGNTQ